MLKQKCCSKSVFYAISIMGYLTFSMIMYNCGINHNIFGAASAFSLANLLISFLITIKFGKMPRACYFADGIITCETYIATMVLAVKPLVIVSTMIVYSVLCAVVVIYKYRSRKHRLMKYFPFMIIDFKTVLAVALIIPLYYALS